MQRSRQTGQRSLHWKRNFSWDVVGEVEFRLKSFKGWSQIFRVFEIVVTSVRNMWRQRSPCTSGWPATLLMKSFKRNPLILYEPKLCFIIRWKACLGYIIISQGNAIWIRSNQQTSKHHKIVTNLFLPQTSEITSRPARRSSMNSSSKIPAAQ